MFTDEQVEDACFAYKHDFYQLFEYQKVEMRHKMRRALDIAIGSAVLEGVTSGVGRPD